MNVPELKDGEWEWEVEKIDDMKIDKRGVVKFLVFWVGYPRPEWKPLEELKHCKELIKEYLDQAGCDVPSEVQNFLEMSD